jgi:hypothetical protein
MVYTLNILRSILSYDSHVMLDNEIVLLKYCIVA